MKKIVVKAVAILAIVMSISSALADIEMVNMYGLNLNEQEMTDISSTLETYLQGIVEIQKENTGSIEWSVSVENFGNAVKGTETFGIMGIKLGVVEIIVYNNGFMTIDFDCKYDESYSEHVTDQFASYAEIIDTFTL